MTASDTKVRLQKLARVANDLAHTHAREAELYQEQAKLFEGLACGEVLVAEKLPRARHLPKFDVSDLDIERAQRALDAHERRLKNR